MTTDRVYLQEGQHTLHPNQRTGIFTTVEGTQVTIDLDISANGRKYRIGTNDWAQLTVNSYTLIQAVSATRQMWLIGMIGLFPGGVDLIIMPPVQYVPTATPPTA